MVGTLGDVQLPKLLQWDIDVNADIGDFGRVKAMQKNATPNLIMDVQGVEKNIVALTTHH